MSLNFLTKSSSKASSKEGSILEWFRLESLNWKDLLDSSNESLFEKFRISEIQNPSTVRFSRLTLALADDLLDEAGHVQLTKLDQALDFFLEHKAPVKPHAESDKLRIEHIIQVLHWLKEDEIRSCFEKIKTGASPSGIDRLIALSLRPLKSCENIDASQLKERHIRVSLLSAWMSYLRQAVGSCFATAPAILVLTQQPTQFLEDMAQILTRGHLQRTIEGKEFVVPASEDMGLADLRKPVEYSQNSLQAPGLMLSLSQAGLFELKGPWQEDLIRFARELKPLCYEIAKESGKFTAMEAIERWVYRFYKVSAKALEDYKLRPRMQIASGSLQVRKESLAGNVEEAQRHLQSAIENFCLWTDHPLLRLWEFTLASFSDTRQDFCLWSLHTSLGLNYEEEGGLANCLYKILQNKVEEYNEKSAKIQPECDNMLYHVEHVKGRLQSARTDQELTWLRADYQNIKAEYDQLLSEQARYHQKAKAFAELFNSLLDEYVALFGKYFQQVYDPQMREAEVGPYDDRPAGFRLVFKAGRSIASSWSPITSSHQFIESLVRFLVITEQEMAQSELVAPIHDDFSQIVTLLVQHVRSHDFIKTSFLRMSKALSLPVDTSSLETMEKSVLAPWAYVSGGTMKSLVTQYYGRSESAEEKKSWFHDLRELWVFLIDIMRDMPEKTSQLFLENPRKTLLMHSATHAFLFLPGHPSFVSSWQNSTYPYTWIRDNYEYEVREVLNSCRLNEHSTKMIFESFKTTCELATNLPLEKLTIRGKLRPHELRREFVYRLKSQSSLSAGQISRLIAPFDAHLLRVLPILDQATVLRRIQEFCEQSDLMLANSELENRESLFFKWSEAIKKLGPEITAEETLNTFYSSYCKLLRSPYPYTKALDPYLLRFELARFKLGSPVPVYFADSNWDHYHFAFVLNPGSDELELWRLKPDSLVGYPMDDWKIQFSTRSNQPFWGVYYKPEQYSS